MTFFRMPRQSRPATRSRIGLLGRQCQALAAAALGFCLSLSNAATGLAQENFANVVQGQIGTGGKSELCGVQMWMQVPPDYTLRVEFYYVMNRAPKAQLAIRFSAHTQDGEKLRHFQIADAAIRVGRFDTREHVFAETRELLGYRGPKVERWFESGGLKMHSVHRLTIDQSIANLPWHAIDVSATTESGARLDGQLAGLTLDQQEELRACMNDAGYESDGGPNCSTEGSEPCDLSIR